MSGKNLAHIKCTSATPLVSSQGPTLMLRPSSASHPRPHSSCLLLHINTPGALAQSCNLVILLMGTAALSGAALPFYHPVCQPVAPRFYPQGSVGMALKSPSSLLLPNLAPSPHVPMSLSPLGSLPLPVPRGISSSSTFLWVASPSQSAPLSHDPL